MPLPLYQVDAFTDQPFTGNPAGVCLLNKNKPDAWMQSLAAEMNLSETAFLLPENDGYRLRWFTPTVEVDLCGHATLASAHIVFDACLTKANEIIKFFTRSGLLTARKRGNWIELDFPVTEPQPATPPAGLLEALGIRANFVGRSRFDYLIEVDDEETVRSMQPDFTALMQVDARGIIVTAQGMGYDMVSRFFAPRVGVNEDPVTGSAHCCLTPYWAQKTGKIELTAFQASKRGGELELSMRGDRVLIRGKAVTIFKAELAD